MNVEIGRQNIITLFWNNEAEQVHFWEYINRNQTFKLDSHRPFICSAAGKLERKWSWGRGGGVEKTATVKKLYFVKGLYKVFST